MKTNLSIIFKVSFWLWLAALLILSYYPKLPTTKIEIGDEIIRLDYIGHLIFYAVLIILFLLWKADSEFKTPGRIFIFSLLVGLAFASINEISQLFIPERTFNPLDLIYNCLGIILGALFIYFGFAKRLLLKIKVKRQKFK
ncbi:MAG: VanZ family protein [Bacteroidetes bacterium]|nr:VanZ family protein [Bacteroidota bacterium]